MGTILSVIGTRPEAIKMAPVIVELRRHAGRLRSVVCATGQHPEMVAQALNPFGIAPDVDLGLLRPGQSVAGLLAACVEGLDRVLDEARPDWVLAQGDTTTVLAAALAAFYRGVPFGHVEAGLRTGDKRRPFPEEVHRRLADAVADLYFAPTETARAALRREGVREADIILSGNTVVDAVRHVAAQPYRWEAGPLAAVPRGRRLVLATAHRRESFGPGMQQIGAALAEIATRFTDEGVHLVVPIHPNPEAGEPLRAALGGLANVSLLEPLDYPALVHLLEASELVLTDSGGLQEEAPALGVPVLVLRDETERPEGVAAGVARLVGTDRARIVAEASRLLSDPAARAAMARRESPYGDGQAAGRIVAALLERLPD